MWQRYSYPELSKNGIMATRFDLRNQISLYKKEKEKQRYVDSLAKNPDLDILATESCMESTCDISARQNDKVSYFPGSSANNLSKISPRSKQHSPLFVPPNTGPLVTFLKQCEDADKTFVEGLHNLINERSHQAKKTFLLQILSQIKTGFAYKKGRKKVDRFIKMCEGDKTIDIKKLAFHLCYLDKDVQNVRKEKELSVKSLDSSTKTCFDVYKNTGICPEIYIRKSDNNKNNRISTALVDTGAETNILSLSALEEVFNLSRSDISPLNHTLSLRSSTGVHRDAVLGSCKVRLSILNENSTLTKREGFHRWSQAVVTFLVANNDVCLTKVILGAPFLEKHRVFYAQTKTVGCTA